MMRPLMRFPGAVGHDPAVRRWLDEPGELRELARRWFETLRRCGADVTELVHDGMPTACVGDAAFAYVGAFKSHVNLGFFCGAALDDPSRLLQGTGKYMRHVKLVPAALPNEPALRALLDAAYADVKARLRLEGG
jgi:hypothetical protein